MMADDGETAIAVGAAAASPLSAAPRTAGGSASPATIRPQVSTSSSNRKEECEWRREA